jgi:hypothetical protein
MAEGELPRHRVEAARRFAEIAQKQQALEQEEAEAASRAVPDELDGMPKDQLLVMLGAVFARLQQAGEIPAPPGVVEGRAVELPDER